MGLHLSTYTYYTRLSRSQRRVSPAERRGPNLGRRRSGRSASRSIEQPEKARFLPGGNGPGGAGGGGLNRRGRGPMRQIRRFLEGVGGSRNEAVHLKHGGACPRHDGQDRRNGNQDIVNAEGRGKRNRIGRPGPAFHQDPPLHEVAGVHGGTAPELAEARLQFGPVGGDYRGGRRAKIKGVPGQVVEGEPECGAVIRDRGQGGIALEPERDHRVGRQGKRSHDRRQDAAPGILAGGEINGELQGIGALGGRGFDGSRGERRCRAVHITVKTEQGGVIRVAFKVVDQGPHRGRRRDFD